MDYFDFVYNDKRMCVNSDLIHIYLRPYGKVANKRLPCCLFHHALLQCYEWGTGLTGVTVSYDCMRLVHI